MQVSVSVELSAVRSRAKIQPSKSTLPSCSRVTPLPSVDGVGEVDAIAVHPTTPGTVLVGVVLTGA